MPDDLDHEVIDSPQALFRHLYEAHGLVEALDLDPATAPLQFWLRKHAELERSTARGAGEPRGHHRSGVGTALPAIRGPAGRGGRRGAGRARAGRAAGATRPVELHRRGWTARRGRRSCGLRRAHAGGARRRACRRSPRPCPTPAATAREPTAGRRLAPRARCPAAGHRAIGASGGASRGASAGARDLGGAATGGAGCGAGAGRGLHGDRGRAPGAAPLAPRWPAGARRTAADHTAGGFPAGERPAVAAGAGRRLHDPRRRAPAPPRRPSALNPPPPRAPDHLATTCSGVLGGSSSTKGSFHQLVTHAHEVVTMV